MYIVRPFSLSPDRQSIDHLSPHFAQSVPIVIVLLFSLKVLSVGANI